MCSKPNTTDGLEGYILIVNCFIDKNHGFMYVLYYFQNVGNYFDEISDNLHIIVWSWVEIGSKSFFDRAKPGLASFE